ncbi:MAG TPA: hypothetical protein DHW22_04280 [Planctomycetaceae bacterium]|nr:hypothetical protein [Planctomycetaceae bacterium]
MLRTPWITPDINQLENLQACCRRGCHLPDIIPSSLARDYVEQKAKEHPNFAAVNRAVEAAGFKIVLLTRLSPVFPYNVSNYLLGITTVRTRDYLFARWIGMLPGTVLYVFLGTAFKSISDLTKGHDEGSMAETILLALGLLVTIVVIIYVIWISR